MNRLPDWQPRLYAFLESRRQAAFSWGTNDCCLFCADAVMAMTGEDPASALRGSYADEAGALAILAEHGGIDGLVTFILGEPMGALCGRTGDVALIRARNGNDVVGVIDGAQVVCVGDVETIKYPLERARAIWRIA